MSLPRSTILRTAVALAATCGVAHVARAQTLATIVPAAVSSRATDGTKTAVATPADVAKRVAMQVLDAHCARCHQSDRLEGRSKPAKGFGNILDMDGLAANPKFVKPGDPDGSLIYHVMVRQEMPSDVFQDGDLDHPTPDAKDYEAIKAWIASLDGPKGRNVEVASLPHEAERIPAVSEMRTVPIPQATAPRAASLDPVDARPVSGAADRPAATAALAPVLAAVPAGTQTKPFAPGKVIVPSAEIETAGEDKGRRLVTDAQKSLKRIGCFTGEPTGVVDGGTLAALGLYSAVMGRGGDASPITPDLLEELQSETGTICLAPPVIASAPPADEERPERSSHETKPAHRTIQAAPARPAVKVARAPVEHRMQAAPPAASHKVARDQHMRQPSFRQAESRPVYRQAQRGGGGGFSQGGGGGGSGSSASSTVSGLSGI